jgi:GTP-binding protein EngB required for normal cell division
MTTILKKANMYVMENNIFDKQCNRDGVGLLSKMIGSMFGNFLDTFKKLFTKEQHEQYKLPSTIVVGSEKTGKSSLLENITKCSIFPKIENKICTKCPIRLRLFNDEKEKYVVKFPDLEEFYPKNSADIYNCVDNYMKKIKEGTIDDKEIIIEISGPNMPYFEFVDLPGIVAVGPIAKATENLVRKYINDRNNIILCVIPATYQRINTYSPLAIIKELNALNNTIVALTMSDKVQDDYYDLQITDRLLKKSDEFEDAKVDNVIAVISHSQRKNRTLIENNKYEQEWFDKNILTNKELLSKYSKNDIKNIKYLLSSSNVIHNLDNLYNKYMHTNWKPTVIGKIDNDIKKLESEYLLLGEPVNKIDVVKFRKILINLIKDTFYTIPFAEFNKIASDTITETNSYIELRNSIETNINNNFKEFCEFFVTNIYNKYIGDIFKNVDLKYGDVQYDNIVLERFSSMKQFIMENLITNLEKNISIYKDEIYTSSVMCMNYTLMKNTFNGTTIVSEIMRLIKVLVLDQLLDSELKLNNYFVENLIHKEKRVKLETDIMVLREHKNKINKL